MEKFQKEKRIIREVYGFDFPEDFFKFWEFTRELPKGAMGSLVSTLSIGLDEVFNVFRAGLKLDKFNPLVSARAYDDPPEFFVVLHGFSDGERWGYWADDPRDESFAVVRYFPNDALQFYVDGRDLLEATRRHIEQLVASIREDQKPDAANSSFYSKKLEELDKIKIVLGKHWGNDRLEQGDVYVDKYNLYDWRNGRVAEQTKDGMGIVLPKEKNKPLASWFEENKPTRSKVNNLTAEAISLCSQGYPGAALKLGRHLWVYPDFYKESYELLDLASTGLGREALRKSLQAAIEFRKICDEKKK